MNIAICDDEKIHIQIAYNYLCRYAKSHSINFEIIAFQTGRALLRTTKKIDILLMDIELEKENGIDLLYNAQKKFPIIIIISSHREELANGYKIKAFRFITKPIIECDLFEALDNALTELNNRKKILAYDGPHVIVIEAKDIIYIEASNRSSGIRTETGFYMCNQIISELSQELVGLDFYSPHRSYLVNLNFVKGYNKSQLILFNDEKIKISRLKYKEFINTFSQFIKRHVENGL